jgi:photosystem II stability/assembly factor-like uncharacterized protein
MAAWFATVLVAPLRIARRALRRTLRGGRIWQVIAAFVGFGLPLAAFPWAQAAGSTGLWERVTSCPDDSVIRQVVSSHALSKGKEGLEALYAVGAGGIYLSVDGGQRWSRSSEGLPHGRLDQVTVLDLALDPSNPDVAYTVVDSPSTVPRPMVYWTVDMGLVWQPRASLGQERVRALAFGPTGDDLYVVTPNDLLRAFVFEPGEKPSLTPQERFAKGVDDLHWLSLYPFDGHTEATTLVISSQPVVTVATPIGTTSARQSPVIGRATSGLPHEGSGVSLTLYIGTRAKGLRIVVDDATTGPTLADARQDAETNYVRQQAIIYAMSIHPRYPEKVYVGTERGVYVSHDAGYSWHLAAQSLRDKVVLAILADPTQDRTLYAGLKSGGVLRSLDDGATWQPLGQGLGRTSVFSLAVAGSQTPVLYAATEHGLWRLPRLSN